ncbi:MAG: Mut7-C RNAse domain-containing protein, partial [Pseudonocardia sp.]|nr:Mut7-C RNAse domain-containing protein [Pseudonocardia sp.]
VARPRRVAGAAGFLLDVHLGALARRLRLLGIDTAYQRDAEDDTLVRIASGQRRVLLTKDRGLLMRRALWAGAYVRGDRPGDQLADVLDRFDPPLAPHSRCPTCNGELVAVAKEAVLGGLRPGTRRSYHRFTRCARCGQVYWRGAHSPGLDAVVAAALSKRCGPGLRK